MDFPSYKMGGSFQFAMLVITRGYTSIFLWFPYGFPIKSSIFLWFPYGFPIRNIKYHKSHRSCCRALFLTKPGPRTLTTIFPVERLNLGRWNGTLQRWWSLDGHWWWWDYVNFSKTCEIWVNDGILWICLIKKSHHHDLPSGKLTYCYGKSPCYYWENSLFLWPFSIAT